MKTLIIHPKDNTTDMLKYVYINHSEYTVCRDNGISKSELRKLIENHDRIIMLGHGLPQGLINEARNGFLIDDSFAELLKSKDTLSMWCYSDRYFSRHNIKGFHTGMIISEVAEEMYALNAIPLNEQEMLENFEFISKCLGDCIEMNANDIKNYMLTHYNRDDEVSRFNRNSFIVI